MQLLWNCFIVSSCLRKTIFKTLTLRFVLDELNHQLTDSDSVLIFTPAEKEYVEKCVQASKNTNVKVSSESGRVVQYVS